MKTNLIKKKSFDFAIRIVHLFRHLQKEKKEFVLSKQLLRSGTAIGALIREAEHAQSKADFIHKMSIALKEANETDYWIDLLYQTNYIDNKSYESISKDAVEILKMLIAIVKTTKKTIING